jgi:hypothetical protein
MNQHEFSGSDHLKTLGGVRQFRKASLSTRVPGNTITSATAAAIAMTTME